MKEIKITNPEKIIYPKDKITKLDVVNYYLSIANEMLPFIKERLLSVIRCHEGINNSCFFKKHPNSDKFINTKLDKQEEYFYIKNVQELVYQVQLGTLEFHTWGSKVNKLEKPDIMIFDLDPNEKLSIDRVRKGAIKVKNFLEELNLQSFLKTSGGKGYHIVIPFENSKNWNNFYDFSKKIAEIITNKWENDFTTNIKKSERKGKIFIDYLRNNRGATCICPYSLRARDNASISMPISWKNLNSIRPNEITIKNYQKYLNSSWKDFFALHQKIK